MLQWHLLPLNKISSPLLYQLIKLRIDVFVVEQTCAYPELDNKDIAEGVHHLFAMDGEQVVAVARLLPAGTSYPVSSIGRVAVAAQWREKKLGHELLKKAVTACLDLWPGQPIKIGAQAHLTGFYGQHGFKVASETYLEDGIPHVDMLREFKPD